MKCKEIGTPSFIRSSRTRQNNGRSRARCFGLGRISNSPGPCRVSHFSAQGLLEACVSHKGVMRETGSDKLTPSYRPFIGGGKTRGRDRPTGDSRWGAGTLPTRRQHVSDTPAGTSQTVMDSRHFITSRDVAKGGCPLSGKIMFKFIVIIRKNNELARTQK